MTRPNSQTVLALGLAAGFAFFGIQKFGTENLVFEILAERSGLPVFEPYLRTFTGVAELATAGLLAIAQTRRIGTVLGLAILFGAIALHLSPWLGIVVPGIGIGLFLTALAMTALVSGLAMLQLRERTPKSGLVPLFV